MNGVTGFPIREKPTILYCEEINACALYHSTDRDFLWELSDTNGDWQAVQITCALNKQRPEQVYNWIFIGEL